MESARVRMVAYHLFCCWCCCSLVILSNSGLAASQSGRVRTEKARTVDFDVEEPAYEAHHLDSGHCKAICLAQYVDVLTRANVSITYANLMDHCRGNYLLADCKACLRGCEVDNTGVPLDCTEQCANNSVCVRSCVLAHDLFYFRPGRCPPAAAIADIACSGKPAAVPIEECRNDGDCHDSLAKCCPTSCMRQVCTRPQSVRSPKAMITSSAFQENLQTQDLINVEWTAENTGDSPVVFVLQHRPQYAADDDDKQWRTIVEDTKMAAQIENIPKCQKYQYRVAAVTPLGRSVFSNVTAYLGSDKSPNEPGKPQFVEVTKVVLRANKVDVELRWSPPTHSDLPIKNYEVSWVKRMRTPLSSDPTYGSVQMQRILKPSEISYTISDLEKDEDFKISVKAISFCGRTPLESKPASVFYRTSVTTAGMIGRMRVEMPHCPPTSLLSDASVSVLYDNDLRATLTWPSPKLSVPSSSYRVEWQLETCIKELHLADNDQRITLRNETFTRGTTVSLSQLLFRCTYELQVRSFGNDGSCSVIVRKRFQTPSCADVRRTSRSVPPNCSLGVLVPPAPENATIRLHAVQDRVEALVNWTLADTKMAALKYRVSFGKSLYQSPTIIDRLRFKRGIFFSYPNLPPFFDHVFDKESVVTKVVNTRSMKLSDLEQNAVYIVQIQTLLDGVHSKATRLYFATLVSDLQNSKDGQEATSKQRQSSTTASVSSGFAISWNIAGLMLSVFALRYNMYDFVLTYS